MGFPPWSKIQEGLHPVCDPTSPPYFIRVHRGSASTRLDWHGNFAVVQERYRRAYQRPSVDTFVMMHNGNPFAGGGDSLQVRETRDALWRLNLGADFRTDPAVPLQHYPVVHIFHLADEWSLPYVRNAVGQGKPIVVSTIYHLPGPAARQIARDAQVLICASEGEKRAVLAHVGAHEEKFRVIPHGISPRFLDPRVPAPPGLATGYLLCVGRFEEAKNQLALLDALEGLDLPVVFVGTPRDYAGDDSYFRRCAAHPYPHKTFAGAVPYEELPAYYRGAHALACVSRRESYGLPVLEGQACGCNLLVTRGSLAADDFASFSELCDPLDRDSLREGVLAVMRAEKSPKPPPQTWTWVAAQIAAIYRGIIQP